MKILQKITLIVTLVIPGISFAQSHFIKGSIADYPSRIIFFSAIDGDNSNIIDTIVTDVHGKFEYRLPDRLAPGMYRLLFNKDIRLDLICNIKEDIDFETNFKDLVHMIKINVSEENKLYFDFLKHDQALQRKLELLNPVIDFYPDDDAYYTQTLKHYEAIQKTYNVYIDKQIKDHDGAMAARIINLLRTPSLPSHLRGNQRIEYLKAHFFDHTDFTDTALIRSTAYTSRAIDYLSLYANPNLTKEQLEQQYIRAVDIILSYAAVNNTVYDFILEYLINGFERYNFELVLDHISLNYSPSDQCENKERKNKLEKRLENYQRLIRGNDAPEIISYDQFGNSMKLTSIQSEYCLVIFWATWCPHCNTLLPEIKKLTSSLSAETLKILAVSLDTLQNAWTNTIQSYEGSWLHCSDLKGWDSKAADDYNIYATPSMFLLDRNKKILAKPVTYAELYNALKENDLIMN